MRNKHLTNLILSISVMGSASWAQSFTNEIRQIQVNSGAEWMVPVDKLGEQLSPLAINPGGARFELWTTNGSTLTDYLLDQRYVGAYVPQATIAIQSEDPYVTRPRTRADRPFSVVLNLDGMSLDPSAPDAARMANILHHVQSYGAAGSGVGVDSSTATLLSQGTIDLNGDYVYAYSLHSIPDPDGVGVHKARGDQRFTIMSLDDYQAPAAQLAAAEIQIWPVADGSIAGMANSEQIRFATPQLTLTLNDLYPDSRTYAQVYKGAPALGTVGMIVPGSAIVINGALPQDRVFVLNGWDSIIEESGDWTMELLTETPFGIDLLDTVTFTINRDIEVNGTVTTVE